MQTAKLFLDGTDQIVRLPDEFRFEGDEVSIRKDPETGEVILSAATVEKGLEEFFRLRDRLTQEELDALVVPPRDRTPMTLPKL